jgi:hypothetical protein
MGYLSSFIVVKTTFEALHRWGNCDIEEVIFLKHNHRHIFHVHMVLPVDHDDRALEFFMVQKEIKDIVVDLYNVNNSICLELGNRSCEMVCKDIIEEFLKNHPQLDWIRVSVFEDDENGAGVMWEKDK